MSATNTKMTEDKSAAISGWHAHEAEFVGEALASPQSGLSSAEAEARLKTYGANALAVAKPRSPLLRMLYQFHNLLLYLMMAAGLLTAFLGEWVDAAECYGVP